MFLHIYVGYELALVHAFSVIHTYYTSPRLPTHTVWADSGNSDLIVERLGFSHFDLSLDRTK